MLRFCSNNLWAYLLDRKLYASCHYSIHKTHISSAYKLYQCDSGRIPTCHNRKTFYYSIYKPVKRKVVILLTNDRNNENCTRNKREIKTKRKKIQENRNCRHTDTEQRKIESAQIIVCTRYRDRNTRHTMPNTYAYMPSNIANSRWMETLEIITIDNFCSSWAEWVFIL